jgi:hypothetical protein
MSRRTKMVQLEGLPEIEIREAPIRDVKPIVDAISTMDPQELAFRLMGISIFVEGHQLTYDRLMNMAPHAIQALMPLAPAIFEVYGLAADPAPEEKKDLTPSSEDSSSSPSSSTEQ